MSRRIVENRADIERNVAYFWNLKGQSPKPNLSETARVMLRQGHNFVGIRFKGVGLLFAPSRFVGYRNNSFDKHKANPGSGTETDRAIDKVAGISPPVPDAKLERAFRRVCDANAVAPQDRDRKYWPSWNAEATTFSAPEDRALPGRSRQASRKGTTSRPTWTLSIPPRPRTKASPRHNRLQEHLYKLLAQKYGEDHVLMEQDFVDISVDCPNLHALIEVKSHRNPRFAIREAMGQLLDYAFAVKSRKDAPESLVLVVAAPGKEDDDSKALLQFIRNETDLDLHYVTIRPADSICPL